MPGKAIAIVNEKGGVGKTTTSVQLAYSLADRGKKVVVIDNDSSGDSSKALFGTDIPDVIALGNKPEAVANTLRMYQEDTEFEPIEIQDNFYFMGAGASDALTMVEGSDLQPAFNFVDAVRALEEEFDYVIIDCPPSFNLLFTAAMIACETGGALIPFVPEGFAVAAAEKVDSRITEMNKRMRLKINVIGFFANNFKVNPMPQSVEYYLGYMAENHKDLLFKAQRHHTTQITDAIGLQTKLTDYAPKSSKAVIQLNAFTEEVIARLEK